MYRSNYHVISFSSNKAFIVITNRTVIAANREVLNTEFAFMVTLSCLSYFVSSCCHLSLTLCHVISIQDPQLQISVYFLYFMLP
jgi:hypothetical protein